MVLSDRADVLHHGLHDAGRHNNAPSVVEEHISIAGSVIRPSDLAYGVQRSRDVGDMPLAPDLAVGALDVRHAFSILLNHFPTGAGEVFA